jgi:GntR family transcriptional regulator
MVTLRIQDLTAMDVALAALPLHERVAAAVRRAIGSGELRTGDPLPTARDLADAFDVHPNTVLRAYRALRDEGTIELRAGRGARVLQDRADHAETGGTARLVLLEQVDELLLVAARYGIPLEEVTALLLERDGVLAGRAAGVRRGRQKVSA